MSDRLITDETAGSARVGAETGRNDESPRYLRKDR